MAIASLRSAQAALGATVRDPRDPKNAYADAFKHVTNPRLRFHRFLPCQDQDEAKRAFLESFEKIDAVALTPYASHYARVGAALSGRGATTADYKTASRLALGLGDETVTEIGIRLHHTYGVPVIAGSAQKGLCIRYASAVFNLGHDKLAAVFGTGGTAGKAGAVAFHDALWKPEGHPFLVDVVAVHHADYYQGETAPPGEWDAPRPLAYLTAQGTFTFALEGEPRAVAFASRVLAMALADWGIGARTTKGYGRFQTGAELPYRNLAQPSPKGAGAERSPVTRGGPASHSSGPAEERSFAGVQVSFEAGRGTFVMRLPAAQGERRAEVKAATPDLFGTRELLEAARARAKKKGFVVCRVTYRVEGNQILVKRLDPDLPPAGGS